MAELAFLFDVDNTLVDNDRVKEDLGAQIEQLVGADYAMRFWAIYEAVRRASDYVDLPCTLARFRTAWPEAPHFPGLAALVLCFPFERYVFPGVLDTIAYLATLGSVAILSDGDPVYQPAKIARAGLADAVDDHVLIYAHKELHLDEVTQRYPAERYVLVDDKADILAAAKARLGDRLLTVHVLQGKYARRELPPSQRPPDRALASVAELRSFSPADFRAAELPTH